jgi:CHAD domain-containing protein
MAAVKLGSKEFGGRYQEKTKELQELTRSLPERLTPDDIHDLRVTARRIQVMRRLLPKSIRGSQGSRRFDPLLKSILKRTSQLRDLDTLMDTLEKHRARLPKNLLTTLENQRSDVAAGAKAVWDLLAESPPPDVDPSEIKGKRLARGLRKRIRKHGRASFNLLSEVLRDESKVEELHTLRKEVKKLRYFLELSEKGAPELDVVTRWQESLGEIHDLDVAVSFLQKSEFDLKGWAVDELRRERHRKYLKFIDDYRVDSMETLGDSAILTGGPVPQGD